MPPTQTEELIQLVNRNHADIMAGMTKAEKEANDQGARLTALEQHVVKWDGHGRGPVGNDKTLGAMVIASDSYKKFAGEMNMTGKVNIKIDAALTSDPGSAGSLAPADTSRARDPIAIPRQRLFVRDLLGKGTTTQGIVE